MAELDRGIAGGRIDTGTQFSATGINPNRGRETVGTGIGDSPDVIPRQAIAIGGDVREHHVAYVICRTVELDG